ncbi:START domain-containing protein [Vibrio rumoiensis]|uniref:START domain-containing protein n=1 Tax=Vibrio rumoiensis 1S-45 TaxID=1188252 RepID=A0A1E5E016_9VIBR|nr:START domain-containing protein [Vibrio rumoiensis]OEF23704.1 hypothetical protein A1QC_11395 [Vibrio rumoiensis 1S-45]
MGKRLLMRYRLFIVAMPLLCSFSVLAEIEPWQPYKQESGIFISQREHDNGLVEIRATTEISTSLSSFLFLLQDVDRAPQWLDGIEKTQVLQQITPDKNIVYTLFRAPWPVKDRDMVTFSQFYQTSSNQFAIEIKSDDAYLPNQDGRIRIRDVNAMWILTKLDNGKTKIDYEAYADPGGILPTWLVNDLARKGALKTFQNLKQILPEYQKKQHPDLLMEEEFKVSK